MKLKPKLDCPHCGEKVCSLIDYIMLPSWGRIICPHCRIKLKASPKYIFLSALALIILLLGIGNFLKLVLFPFVVSWFSKIIFVLIIFSLEMLLNVLWTCFFPLEEIDTYPHSTHHDDEYYEEQRRRSNPDWYDENGNRKK